MIKVGIKRVLTFFNVDKRNYENKGIIFYKNIESK